MGRTAIEFDQELADFICERIATTELGLQQVLNERKEAGKSCVSATTVWRWKEQNEDFRNKSARARLMQAELLHDQANVEARTALIGTIESTKETKDGTFNESRVSDNVERSKLIVQTLLKRAGQLDPKKYGDKVQQEVTGSLGVQLVNDIPRPQR